jgi:hypothetical protein
MKDAEIEKALALVESYIYEKTNRKVKIVFDNQNRMSYHIKMLFEAYSVALTYYNNKK